MDQSGFRELPAVHRLLSTEQVQDWLEQYARSDVVAAVQDTLELLREKLRLGETVDLSIEEILEKIFEELHRRTAMHLRQVINATGTVLHTNLGRAPLAVEAIEAVVQAAQGYSNLEFDLVSGGRGHRFDHVESLLCELTGAEAALVVNNNAAAVYLTLQELAHGKNVVISRGELVEIGGSFRVSEVMRLSGANLVEVGTTNKTHEIDYKTALEQGAELLLRVHTSNFRICGFTYQPPLAELVAIAREFDVPIIEDLGSGSLLDLRAKGIGDEPTVKNSIDAGVDVVMFSGDKLLGAAQAGVICGKKKWIDRIKKNQLARAVRVDKLTLAALEATLRLYRDEEKAFERIPTLHMLTKSIETLRTDAERLAREVTLSIGGYARCRVLETSSTVGGGAMPLENLPTTALAIYPLGMSPAQLVTRLRQGDSPIIARIAREEVIIDVRTIFDWQYEVLIQGIKTAVAR